jgi:hypothetical protein
MADKITRDWVRGFIDRSAHVHSASSAIEVASVNEDLLRRVWAFLRADNYDVRLRRKGTQIVLRIGGLKSLRRWVGEYGFIDPIKAEQLKKVLDESEVE